MSNRFHFPCPECDQSFEITTTQAGSEVACPHCSQTVALPTLGALKRLEPVDAPSGRKEKQKVSGWVTVGLAAGILAALAGIGLYQYASSMINETDIEGELAKFNEQIDQFTAPEVIGTFEFLNVEEGLGEWKELTVTRYNAQGRILQNVSYGLFGLSAIGFVIAAVSLTTGNKKN